MKNRKILKKKYVEQREAKKRGKLDRAQNAQFWGLKTCGQGWPPGSVSVLTSEMSNIGMLIVFSKQTCLARQTFSEEIPISAQIKLGFIGL